VAEAIAFLLDADRSGFVQWGQPARGRRLDGGCIAGTSLRLRTPRLKRGRTGELRHVAANDDGDPTARAAGDYAGYGLDVLTS